MCNIVVLRSDGSKKRCERDDDSILSGGETLLYRRLGTGPTDLCGF